MTDKEKIVILLKGAEIEFEDWNKRLITLDDFMVMSDSLEQTKQGEQPCKAPNHS